MNGTNHERSDTTSEKGGQYSRGFLFILPIIFCVIFIGNVLLLVAIKSFRVRRVPDLLIGSLAVIDLLNDLGPVLISIVVFQIDYRGFQSGRISYELCQFYNWISSFLRLSASFLASLMALDCFCATLQPIYYRTKVTCDKVTKLIFCVVLSAAFISAFPAMGWGRVQAHRGVCSFNFDGGFAQFIAVLGYVQLVIVLSCFVAVARKMNKYEKRFGGLQRGRTLTFLNGKLQAMEMQTASEGRTSNIEENGIHGSSNSERTNNTTRGKSTSVENDDSDKITEEKYEQNATRSRESKTDPSFSRCRVNRHVKESRQFTKVLGSAVFLFYVSWMPIIFTITAELATGHHHEVLQSLSAQMSLLCSMFNPWVYCGLSRPYRAPYICVLRRLGGVCGLSTVSQHDIVTIADTNSRFRTSTRRIFPQTR